ncbi:N-acetylmuramic acid 6-phosphate etherase [Sphingobacterium sp. UT-1RO-CII-1]|uniref:N-acetylmuramic acid 6-phosphate etherase n=1 Tax=Sphingobacterium sp. UT-1RO-CII-1 TaxID=2995225 RepID=UPI00227D1CEC|nr:N-acetylmuramic acid 6-phosphate etherase [Sphingobacterium sp. UT-1RO-CII-1]MCY4778483.1 N-acetylmuramic acid 6-phosphate etherase [Sphingobacterium sp. UT-1RO-CII-1]
MIRVTEAESHYEKLEDMSVRELLVNINREDQKIADAVEKVIPQLEPLVTAVVDRMKRGGRLFYIGAGTSGRLGILDASECPPTFGVPFDWVIGIIAGGDSAIRKAVEFAEDDEKQAWLDLKEFDVNPNDVVVGIAASGTTPYVIGGLKKANEMGLATACIVCNSNSPIAQEADFPVEVIVGPEFVTGSTRMKAGTAQKLVLNMLSTSVMIQLGRVKGNKMIDMQLSNVKLVDRAVRMVMEELSVSEGVATSLIKEFGTIREAIENYKS